jgi:hypothetical protein
MTSDKNNILQHFTKIRVKMETLINKFLIFKILLFLVLSPKFITTFPDNDIIETFITQLKLSRFANCAIFFFRHNHEGLGNFAENVIPRVVSKVGVVAYYSALHNSSEILSRFPIPTVNAYNRRAPVCKLGIIMMAHENNVKDETLAEIKT